MRPQTKTVEAIGLIGQYVTDHWDVECDPGDLLDDLLELGFSDLEISDAFRWIEDHTLANKKLPNRDEKSMPPNRILTTDESSKLSPAAQSQLYLWYTQGIVDPLSFDEIIERVVKSADELVGRDELKRITALTLFSKSFVLGLELPNASTRIH